jgi:hypothetical protein
MLCGFNCSQRNYTAIAICAIVISLGGNSVAIAQNLQTSLVLSIWFS